MLEFLVMGLSALVIFHMYSSYDRVRALRIGLLLALAGAALGALLWKPAYDWTRIASALFLFTPPAISAAASYFVPSTGSNWSVVGYAVLCLVVGPLSLLPVAALLFATGQVWGT